MSALKAIRARVRALFLRRTADDDLRAEIDHHLALETEKNIRLGMSPDEARRIAVAHFGGVQSAREAHRDVRRFVWLEDLAADAKFALRALRRTPALGAAATLTIALGIGANVAIFSALNAVVLQPLPLPTPDRLMVVTEENPEKHWHLQVAAPANMIDWRSGVSDFADVAGYLDGSAQTSLLGRGDAKPMNLALVTGSFFSTLGVTPSVGETFRFEDSMDENARLVVMSYDLWQREFGGDRSIVGKTIALGSHGEGKPYRVVGIAPRGFAFPRERVDLWQCFTWAPAFRNDVAFRRAHMLRVVARLKPGATGAHADAQLQSVAARLKHDYPETNKYMGALMMPLHDYLVRDTRVPLLVLMASVALLLLIACANVGNLLLVQAAGRERETALRLALGASRQRLVRQAITESLVLSTIGGALGLGAGWAGTRVLVRMQPEGLLPTASFGVDTAVILYVIAITIASGILFGIAPAVWTRHRDPASSLKDGGRGAVGRRQAKRWNDVLVVGEVALALLMAVGGGLLARSFWNVRHVDPGFDPKGLLGIEFGVGGPAFDSTTKVESFMTQLRERAHAIPTVTGVALSVTLPLSGPAYTSDFIAYGRAANDYGTEIGHRSVSPEYFRMMHIPIVAGRGFTADDRLGGDPVVLINEALAKSYFKDENPVGQRMSFDKVPDAKSKWYTIIGVAANEHSQLDADPHAESYVSLDQFPETRVMLLLRTSGEPMSVATPARSIIRELDPGNVMVINWPVEERVAKSTARIRFLTTLMLAFACVGVVLSVVGVYGVLAQTARGRMREMGIRIALGAQSGDVRWLIVKQGLGLTAAGLAAGGVAGVFATRLMSSVLFGVSANDPLTLGGVAIVLAATSVLAAWLPALRASRADPATSLRAD